MMKGKNWKRRLTWCLAAAIVSSGWAAAPFPVQAEAAAVDGAGPVFEDAFTEGTGPTRLQAARLGLCITTVRIRQFLSQIPWGDIPSCF